MRTASATLFGLVGLVSAIRTQTDPFALHPVANPAIVGWAVLGSPPQANGDLLLEVERPSVFQSDTAFLAGTNNQDSQGKDQLFVEVDGESYSESSRCSLASIPTEVPLQVL
jgi:hypothetical protein